MGARSYFVRVETPYGPRAFFTDDTRVRLSGDLRNADADGLPRVFIPGFPQAVTVSAVDSNYYDWFRTHNDVLSGTGLLNQHTLDWADQFGLGEKTGWDPIDHVPGSSDKAA